MDFKNLNSHFAATSWEPKCADNAWKSLFGDRAFDLESLSFKERLETAKAWRLETIKLAREHARTRDLRDSAAFQRRTLIQTLSQRTKFQQLSQGEQDMQDTIQNYQPQNFYDDKQSAEQERAEQERAEQIALEEKEAEARTRQVREYEERDLQLREQQQVERQERANEVEAERELAEERRLEDEQSLSHNQSIDHSEILDNTQSLDDRQTTDESNRFDDDEKVDDQRQEDERALQEEQRLEVERREEDERAYKAAEEKFKELQDLERQRQAEDRLGGNSADSLLSRFFEIVEKVKQEHEQQQQQREQQEREQQELPDVAHQNQGVDSTSSVADFHRQSIDDLLNSFDKSLDVEKDIDLNVEGPMLIDGVDRGFDLDRDVESNWNFEDWAEKEFSLDDVKYEPIDLTSAYSSNLDNIKNLLFGNDEQSQSLEWEKNSAELQIEGWQKNAYDPAFIKEQNDLSLSSVREGGSHELGIQNNSQQNMSEHNSLDQIMQQHVQQVMQSQIHQSFTEGAQRSPSGPELSPSNKEEREQEQGREDDGSERSR